MSARMKIGVCAVAVLALGGVAVASRQGASTSPTTAQAVATEAAPQAAVQAPAGAELVWSQDPASKCRFVVPRSLPSGPTYWTGACPDGKASGLGMLRRRDGNQSGEAFYGELQGGVPLIGVIDLRKENSGGFIAGNFTGGDIGQGDSEGQEIADAFETAARAARAVSVHFQTQQNDASARFYEQQAATLEDQIR